MRLRDSQHASTYGGFVARSSSHLRVLLDSCCFLVYIANQQEDAATARRLLSLVDSRHIELVESTCILVEVLPTHKDDDGSGKRMTIHAMLGSDQVDLRPVTHAIAERAADYMTTYRLKSMDAIHLATAVDAEATALVTLDESDFPTSEVIDAVRILTPDQFLTEYFPPDDQPELIPHPSSISRISG